MFFAGFSFVSCKKDFADANFVEQKSFYDRKTPTKPNIILFVADDMGYEIPGYTGGQTYATPYLDYLANNGIRFTNAYSHPDGYPSRLAMLTGKYNFRNYTNWGQLPTGEKTIGNMMKDAGYATCFVGKWQCDGGDARIKEAGFDNYRVFMPFAENSIDEYKYLYKNPHLYENGSYLSSELTNGRYSEDMYVEYVQSFVTQNYNKPFFVIFSHNLPRNPWGPTPLNPEFQSFNPDTITGFGNNKYFPEMVNYLDRIIGRVTTKLKSTGYDKNTLIMFLNDNGTNKTIKSTHNGKTVQGGKNLTSDRGVHSPLIAYWPGTIAPGQVSNAIVDYPDFLPTLADVAKISRPVNYGYLDGISFYDNLIGAPVEDRTWGFCHWDNRPHDDAIPPARFVYNKTYKLYDDPDYNRFYNIATDPEEKTIISESSLTPEELEIKNSFISVLQQMVN